MEAAVRHHQAGRFADAEVCYRQILAQEPNHVESLHRLGILAAQIGRPDIAVQLMERVAAIDPSDAGAFSNLGTALNALGRTNEAIAAYQNAVRLKPDSAEVQCRLGNACQAAWRMEEAIEAHLRVVQLQPKSAGAHYNLGNAYEADCQLAKAIDAYHQAIELQPDYAEAHNNLAGALQVKGEHLKALDSYREAVRLVPDRPEYHNNLGSSLQAAWDLDAAIVAYENAIRLKPDYADAYCNLAACYKSQARIEKALACYRKAVSLAPNSPAIHNNLVYAVPFDPTADAAAILAESRRWDLRHGQPFKQFIAGHPNDRSPDRRIRVGFLSPDLRNHVVGRNLLPFVREHDKEQIEIICYADVLLPDAVTRELRSAADDWRDIVRCSDAEIVEMIRADRIDILVDLTLHMAPNRLRVFACKPAPVQVTYLGYCGTTGLEAMDYRLSDPYFDPPGSDLSCYREETIRLPRSYWCYEPLGATPAVSSLPALSAGFVTFGCLNSFSKVSDAALALWLEVLRAKPASRLLLQAPSGSCRREVVQRFRAAMSPEDRLEFVGMQSWEGYLETLQRLDIALDPFPYGGGITTCDGLWMGVPLVTLAGRTSVGRGGKSILSNLGLPELVAETPEQFLRIAVSLAEDLPRLTCLRSTLRERMERSPLRDAPGHAREVEAALRGMWEEWCRQAP